MLAAGIIFADSHHEHVDELTRRRTMASIPFGGRYRLVDFQLSNFVNADVTKIAVVTRRNYQSLMDHIGSGKDWDLSRRNGGVMIFPPYGYYASDISSDNRYGALQSIIGYISKCQEEDIIMVDCDSASVVDYSKALEQHIERKADLTVCYCKMIVTENLSHNMCYELAENERIVSGSLHSEVGEMANIGTNAWIIKRKVLYNLLVNSTAHGARSFTRDVLLPNLKNLRSFGYLHTGIYLDIHSMESYFEQNMKLLDSKVRDEVFNQKNLSVYTKVRDSAPTKYGLEAKVVNSYIADGCVIEGTVINSILFRGVKVEKNTIIENSILMQDTDTGEDVHLNYVITDKNVTIRNHQTLSGCKKIPYYLAKNVMI